MKKIKIGLIFLCVLLSAALPVLAESAAGEGKTVLYTALAVLLVPLLAALLITGAKVRQMKTARPDNYASNYIKDGSFQMEESRDIYLYSTLVKTPRPKENRK